MDNYCLGILCFFFYFGRRWNNEKSDVQSAYEIKLTKSYYLLWNRLGASRLYWSATSDFFSEMLFTCARNNSMWLQGTRWKVHEIEIETETFEAKIEMTNACWLETRVKDNSTSQSRIKTLSNKISTNSGRNMHVVWNWNVFFNFKVRTRELKAENTNSQ